MNLLFPIIIFLLVLAAGYYLFQKWLVKYNKTYPFLHYCGFLSYIGTLIVFISGMQGTGEYYQGIDHVEQMYTPLAAKHIVTMIVFLFLSVASSLLLWLKGRLMPPLLLVLALIFQVINITGSITVLIQVSHTAEEQDNVMFLPFPVVNIVLSLLLIFSVISQSSLAAPGIHYQNKMFVLLNRLLANMYLQPVWIILLLWPVFLLVVFVLTLFGQDAHAATKIFTDTTTWHFSRQQHPPDIGHSGHYLCTVAACGHRRLVKPLRFGCRYGSEIIVNRQLQVANAFEQLLQEARPGFHKHIRQMYDKYGYSFSRHITKPIYSDVVYLFMKPLEYFFVAILYLSCLTPEERIAKQYP